MVEMCRLVSRLFRRDIRFPVHVLAGIWLMAFTLGLADTGLAQDSEFVLRGTIHAGATQMVAQDTRLAVADAQTLRIFDISEPEIPAVISQYEFADNILGLTLSRDVVYVANGHEGFQRLDVSNPAAPVVSGVSPTRGQANAIAVIGPYAFVADNSVGFDVVRVIDDVARVGEYLADGFPRSIAAAGNFIYLVDQPEGLIVLDITTPETPEPIGQLPLGGTRSRVFVPQWLPGAVVPTVICVLGGRDGLQVVDVSDPTAPTISAQVPTSGQPRGVVLRGQEAFVLSDATFEVFDLSDPRQPVRVASHNVGTAAGAMAVNDELVFVSVADEILIFARS